MAQAAIPLPIERARAQPIMPRRLPLLVRTASASRRILRVATHLHDLFWDEVLCAWFSPRQREAINGIAWSKQAAFLPGGYSFERGLAEWERVATSEPPFPQAGRILLGGAGGGRELAQLCRRGFDVVAFEPSALCEGARQVAAPFPKQRRDSGFLPRPGDRGAGSYRTPGAPRSEHFF